MVKLSAMVAVLIVSLAAAGPADAARPGAGTAARGYAKATLKEKAALNKAQIKSKNASKPIIESLHACTEDFATAPDEHEAELRFFYSVAVSAPLWAAQRSLQTTWLKDLKRTTSISSWATLRTARSALAAQLAYVESLYAQPIDACAEIRAWRAEGWGIEQRPAQLARLHPLEAFGTGHRKAWDRAHIRAALFVAKHGGSAGNKASENVYYGITAPIGLDYCDPVYRSIEGPDPICGN